MKRLAIKATLASLLFAGLGNAQTNVLSPTEAATGFRLLFDGTIASFRANFVNYQQNNTTNTNLDAGWILNATDQAVSMTSGNLPDIRTVRMYADMDLRMDYRNNGNQGLIYRHLVTQGSNWATGVELAIEDNVTVAVKISSGAAYDIIPPNPPVATSYRTFSTNQWNTLRLVVKGDSVEHYQNGYKIVGFRYNTPSFWNYVSTSKWTGYPSYCLNTPGVRTSGHIANGYWGFQANHGGVWRIRNFRVAEGVNVCLGAAGCVVPVDGKSEAKIDYNLARNGGDLRLTFGLGTVKSAELYDMSGRVLQRVKIPMATTDISLGGREIRKGLYMLRLDTPAGILSRKVFVP